MKGSPASTVIVLAAALMAAGCSTTPGETTGDETATPSSSTPAASTSTAVPPVSDEQAAVGFVDIRTVVPDAKIDLAYTRPDNFTGMVLYPKDARCLVHESMVDGLKTAAARLADAGLRLIFWDCYRPYSVQVRMYEAVPADGWVAKPSGYSTSHVSGRSVDVGLLRGDDLVDMGSGYDTFVPESNAYSDLIDDAARRHRALLIDAMAAGGINVYDGEWWHFDMPDAYQQRPIIDVPVK